MRSVHIKTFGCQMNVYDSDRMLAVLAKQGYRLEPELAKADVILLNTCAIRAKAEQKVLSLLGQLRPLKESDPKKIIGVTGCVGQRMGRNLLQRVPYLDLVMGPDGIDRVGEFVGRIESGGSRVLEIKLDEEGRSYEQPAIVLRGRPTEFITIMKGCDHFCTYCIVPYVRGREKSRSISEIIDDTRRFVAHGTKEITYLGQNINTYGKGTGENLAQLVAAANEVEGLERIRYVTSHPRDLSQDMIDQFGTIKKLCPSLHLPFQSGSSEMLKKMSRLYTREDYLKKVELLRKACPHIALSADAIVGFPGETEADFEQTLSLVSEVKFSFLFMFKYSPRPGTKAFAYGDTVPETVKEERLARLQAVAYEIITAENVAKVGSHEMVLIESMDKKARHYSGRTLDNKLVHVLNAGDACLGKIIEVEITEANTVNLKGYFVGAPKENNYEYHRRTSEALSASL